MRDYTWYIMIKTFLLFLFILPLFSTADDGFIGTIGGNVFPIWRSEQIRMSKEEIRIKMFKDSCIVTCKFWFTNETSDTAKEINMGFPDFIYEGESQPHPLRSFTCRVRGNRERFYKKKQIIYCIDDSAKTSYPMDEYQYWYCWDVNVNPKETVLVENTYVGDWGGSNDGTCNFF